MIKMALFADKPMIVIRPPGNKRHWCIAAHEVASRTPSTPSGTTKITASLMDDQLSYRAARQRNTARIAKL